jgi:hypothetical protein
MNSTIPAEVLALKSRLDQWRSTRSHIREQMPDQLREAIAQLARHHSPTLLRRILKVDPWRMIGSTNRKAVSARKKNTAAFFHLPPEISAPAPRLTTTAAAGFRLQLERPDGARLTLILPALDLGHLRQFCADFLPDNK